MRRSVEAVVLAMSLVFSASSVMAEETTVQLQEVVVTATKTEKDPKDVTQTVTVITGEEIKKSGALNVAEAVRAIASVSIREYGAKGSVSQIGLRGATSAQVLVLLDGKRLNSARSGGYNLTDLPVTLEDIERIEIVRGPSSALYGADAVGGVINIITKKPVETRSRISGTVGSHGYDLLTARQEGIQGSFYYALSGGRETSDGYRRNSDLDQKNAGVKAGFDFTPDTSLELNANYLGKETGVPGSETFETHFARQWNREAVAGLDLRTRFTRNLDLKVSGYYNRDVVKYKNPDPFFPEDSRHKGATKGVDLQANWLTGPWSLITVGAEARGDSMTSTDAGDRATRLTAAYLQDEISIGESLIIVVGGRYDNHSVYGDQVNPKASARYLITRTGTIFRVSGGRSFRAPTLNDLYWPDTMWTAGNPNLRPEVAKEYEAGVEQPLGDGSVIKVTAFKRKVRDLIEWQPDASFKYSPVNIGRASLTGGEAEAKIQLIGSLTWGVNYTYTNAVNEVTREKIYYTVPKSQLKTSLSLALPTKTNVYLEGRSVENYVKPTDPETEWKYGVVDGKISQAVSLTGKTKGEVFLGMNNIFDRKYEVVQGYPMAPKEIYGGMSVQF